MSRASRSLAISVRIYRTLLWAYPRAFRREYGPEMTHVFRDMAQAAVDKRGALGLAGLWLRVVPDLVWTAAQERLEATQRRIVMWQRILGRGHFVKDLAVAMLIAALVTPTDPASMLMIGFPLYGVYLCACLSGPLTGRGRVLATLSGLLNLAFWVGVLVVPAQWPGVRALLPSRPRIESLILVGLLVGPLLTTALTAGAVALIARAAAKTDAPGPSGDAMGVD